MEIFDLISYSKGASVVRMVENYIGTNPFKKGMNIYLNRHKYKNAATEVNKTVLNSKIMHKA